MDIQTMSQAEKDQLLNQFLAEKAREARLKKAKELGLSWSKNGFISVALPKVDDKSQPSLYIAPRNVAHLQQIMGDIVEFATTAQG